MAKKPVQQRMRILEVVRTPLALFTLGILVSESILATLSMRATGVGLTILIAGMVASFLLCFVMVFVLALRPDVRHRLLGDSEPSPLAYIDDMLLTRNDIRILHALSTQPSLAQGFGVNTSEYFDSLLIGAHPGSFESRIRKFEKLRFVEKTKFGYELTAKGRQISNLVVDFAGPVLELQRVGKI